MSYDLFISYSRRDNERGQVATLKAQIETSFRAFAGRELQMFFDTHEIHGMDDWQQKIQRSLRDSHLFLAVLSPNYLASPYCRWEWEDYVRYEAMRQCLGEGVAPVFFVTLPDAATPQADQAIGRWIDEINHRQTFDLRPWHDHGEKALQEAHVRTTLEQLQTSVRERLDRAERARRSPNNLIKHNPAFVGRVPELTALRQALAKNKLGVVGARQGKSTGPVTVQGLGGMGKTELALAYAHAFAWDYPGGRWQIPCEHTGDLRLALSRLAGPMQFEFTEDEKKDLALQFERVLRELQRRERCLLVLDNVSDPHLLEPEYLDRLPRDGHLDLIATTRLAPTAIPGSAQDSNFIAVDELPEEDALALLRSHQPAGRFDSQDEDNEARQIVRLLRGFTLAVETAAIYLGRHPAPDACRQFRERLSPDLLRESEQAATDPTVAVRHRVRLLDETLAFTLATLTEEARHLLTFAALLPADQVAVPWLRVLGAERYPAFQDETGPAFRQPLDLLLDLRLFQPGGVVDADGRLLIARMHRLVQDLMRQKTPAADLAAREQVVNVLVKERAAVLEKTTHWEDARWELEPFGALAKLWDDTNHPDATWLLSHAGLRWHDLAEWNRGEPLMRRALAIDEKNLGQNNSNVATGLNNLARLLAATNRYKDAEPLYRRALLIDEQIFGSDHPNVIVVLNNLALLLQATHRVKEAELLFRRALTIAERSFGQEHPTVATSSNSLAQLLCDTKRFAEAEPLLRRALGVWTRSLGNDHPNVASALNNLAQLLWETDRLAEAEPLMQQALAIAEHNFGPDHPTCATALSNLARLLQVTNRQTDAEPLMRRALGVAEHSFGPDHPTVATHLNNLAELLRETDRLSEAEPLYRRALAIGEKSFGPNHPTVASVLHNLAVLLQVTNRLAEAEVLYLRALAVDEESFGPNHPTVASVLHNLAQLLETTNRHAEAESLMYRAVAIDEQNYGPDHPKVGAALADLAYLLFLAGNLMKAEPLLRRALCVLLKSSQTSGYAPPRLEGVAKCYAGFLVQMGHTKEEAIVQLNAIGKPFGIRFGG